MSNKLDRVSFGKIVQIRERLLKTQATGKKVYRFESGDPSFSVSDQVIQGIRTAAETGKTHYIPNDGIPELKNELRKKLEAKNKITLPSSDCIYVTNGAMHALYVLWQCLLDKGDEVIVPDPMWTEAVENIRLAEGTPVPVILNHDKGYVYEAAEIESKITSKTKAIFINSPHNPTGSVLDRENLTQILALAQRKGLYIVTDEAYEDVVYDAKHYSLAALAQELYQGTDLQTMNRKIISIFSFSKSYAMSGLRVGYIVTQDDLIRERISKLLRCTINGVNSIAQWASIEAVRTPETHLDSMKKEYRIRRDLMLEGLKGIPGLHTFTPQGAFYIWCKIDPELYKRLGVKSADEISNRLAEQGIGSAPGDSFGVHCEDAIRFAYSCATPMVQEGIKALKEFFAKA
ncbi:aminotransferase class I/II-fold pyridoxal phosphate-dependent enzyme [Bdellovibrionota bacterium FG-2]